MRLTPGLYAPYAPLSKTPRTWWATMVPSRFTPVLTCITAAWRGFAAMNSSR